uniref:DDRGK domain-containing protein 1 n=1 Tax=Trichobilharzia regenti TaxID=157069 RepID=A0AA85IV25_TRIRE|nr:unnamed protein product [Trichobilharzia regenti]
MVVPVAALGFFSAILFGIFIFWKFYGKISKTGGSRPRMRPAATAGGVRRRAGQRRVATRMRDASHSEEEERVAENLVENPDAQTSDDDQTQSKDTPKKKIGAKKAAKLAEKERRKEEREAEERYREHQRKIEDKEIEKRKKEEEAEERAAAAAAAAEAKRLEEEAAREQAEYERLKQEFSIEEEGVDAVQQDNQAENLINSQLIAAIEEAKIIPIEHLAVNLGLKTEVCVEKIKSLMSSGRLSGVLDDRGKFVHITDEEYEAVAEFIEKRGRITLAELVENGHKLIHTGPHSLRE